MKKNYTHISLVLDRSGSMHSIANDTIGGFNTFLKSQQEEKGECTFSMVQFDDEYNVLYTFTPIKEVPKLSHETFVPRGMTALHDAIGKTIVTVGEELTKMNEEDRPEKVLIVILTDGLENKSQEYTSSQINKLIKNQTEKYKWQFIFLAANQDAIKVGGGLGIKAGNSMTFRADSCGVDASYGSVSKSVSNLRSMSVENYNKGDVEAFSSEDRKKQEEAK